MAEVYNVAADMAGERLDNVLVTLAIGNKTSVGKAIKTGLVHVNGYPVTKAGHKLMQADQVTFTPPVLQPRHTVSALDLEIMYQDEDLLVINKPAGLLVHPARNPSVASVLDFSRLRSSDTDRERPGIVHRLDRETSGLLIIAKTAASKQYLQAAFKKRDVKKRYRALVHGHLETNEGIIDLPIDRATTQPTKRQVAVGGRKAITKYKVLAVYPEYSLIELEPLTGRTHQLRVHLAHIGHPIVGDTVYGAKGRDNLSLTRHFLHASELNFIGPNGQVVAISSVLPAELENVLARL